MFSYYLPPLHFLPLPFPPLLSVAQVTESIALCLIFHTTTIRVISEDPTAANESQKHGSHPEANSCMKEILPWKGKELHTHPAVLIIHATLNKLAHQLICCESPDDMHSDDGRGKDFEFPFIA